MYIIAVSYTHIGPFFDRQRTVRFLPGAALIKAPIGSGKSFLFFDGPIFGLYKWSSRPLLSRHATTGQVQVLFSHAGSSWLIIRDIKATKMGNDSVTSRLFRVTAGDDQLQETFSAQCGEQVICDDVIITTILPDTFFEEIESRGQKEVDALIVDLLPAREVTLSSCILLQDSDNVFEMTPAERIDVFKQLFDLLDMDYVKDRLSDIKKETQLRRQVLQEDVTIHHQCASAYATVRTLYTRVVEKQLPELTDDLSRRVAQPFFSDMSTLAKDDMRLDTTLLHGYDATLTLHLLEKTDRIVQDLLVVQGQKRQLLTQQEHLRAEQTTLGQTFLTNQRRLDEIAMLVADELLEERARLQKQGRACDAQLDLLWQEVPVAQAESYGLILTTFSQARQCFAERIVQAKQLQQEIQFISEKETLLDRHYTDGTDRLQTLVRQQADLEAEKSSVFQYRCDKIQQDCPYVAVIRKSSSDVLDAQITALQTQQSILQTSLQEFVGQQQQLAQQKRVLEKELTELKELFTVLKRKDLEQLFDRVDLLTTEKKQLTDALAQIETRLATHTDLLQERERLEARMVQYADTKQRLDEQEQHIARQLATFSGGQHDQTIDIMKQVHDDFRRIDEYMRHLAGLVEQYISRQQEITRLQEKERLVKDLVHIFQKELLVVVLQDFLPMVETVINDYLHQVVDFSLRFELPKTVQEDIQIAIWIEDHLGKRAVKSLSGGQKAVLRLCWILAISSLFKQEYLLLDETINSLDQDAIGRVAELLDSFVQQRQISFYLVTHAPQIQEMSFWQRVIEVR